MSRIFLSPSRVDEREAFAPRNLSVSTITAAVKGGCAKTNSLFYWPAINPSIFQPIGEMSMCKQSIISSSLQATFLFLLSFVCSYSFAQAPVSAQALTHTVDDPQLKWGPCPPFLPKGCAIAVLHGDPAKDNLDVFFKVPGKSNIPLHWHTSAERMVLVAGELHVTYEGQKTAILKPGMYAYGPAKRPHHGFCASAVPCVLFIAFESPLDAVPVENTKK